MGFARSTRSFDMASYQFLQTYARLQEGIVFDELIDMGFGLICHSQADSSSFWNNALVNSDLDADQIRTVESKLLKLNRKPAFYYENRAELVVFTERLQKLGYKQVADDSFMFHSGENIDTQNFDLVKKVLIPEDLEVFLHTFDKCYRKDDPLNPYGELGEYLEVARQAWQKHHATNRIEYFIVFDKSQPVAVSSLTNFEGVGYISNVGSLVSVRGRGFGKLATMYCIHQSKQRGNTNHCLATEAGTNPNSFYKAVGFKTRFSARLMNKTAV